MGAVLARQPSFRIQTRDFHLFFEDPRADGGHTFVFKVQPTPAIFSLQQSCSDFLKLWRTRNETGENDGLIECEPFRSSFLQYGFPFVGSFWIPHFTVASLKIPRASPLLREFSSHESRHEFTLEKVSVWEIDGDSHKKLFELPLGGIIKGE